MIINHNAAALNTFRQLNKNQQFTNKSMEKLGSGLRINKAGDDAAGLAISEKMRAQVRGLDQASRNAQDGISYIQTAEGAMQETHSILQRMRELAVQASNDTNVGVDRQEIQKEINQLTSEINRIGTHTQFNTKEILRGTKAEFVGEVDYGGTTLKNLNIDIDSKLKSGNYSIRVDEVKVINPAFSPTLSVSNVNIDPDSTLATGNYKVAVEFDYTGTYVTNSGHADTGITSIEYDGEHNNSLIADGYTLSVIYNKEPNYVDPDAENKDYTYTYTVTISNNNGYSKSEEFSGTIANEDENPEFLLSNEKIGNFTLNGVLNKDSATNTEFDVRGRGWAAQLQNSSGTQVADWVNIANPAPGSNQGVNLGYGITANFGTNFSDFQSFQESHFTVDQESAAIFQDDQGNEETVVIRPGNSYSFNSKFQMLTFDIADEDVVRGNVAFEVYNPDEYFSDFQIGANMGQSLNVAIKDVRANILNISSNYAGGIPLESGKVAYYTATRDVEFRKDVGWNEFALDMSTHEKATANISVLDEAIAQVSSERSRMGAYQNRLEHTTNNLTTSSENLQAAESRIRDVDMAREVMEMTKNNILSQASQAMLAQANQAPQSVLQLLG